MPVQSTDVIRVEQRLQDPPQFLIFPADEAAAAMVPFFMGLMTKQAIPGLLLAIASYYIWKRIKGERGLPGLVAIAYWIMPTRISLYKSLPDSAVVVWRA